ncbi:MAG: hypothetical protein MAG715_00291 [Methanonatronarchaeales archaeon]|nr:hypothetical protein [Methanonatronarchaeales archaeon]
MIFGHGLKETDPVIEALVRGEQVVLPRKGGTGEDRFGLEGGRFLLLPTRKEKKRGRYDRYDWLLTGDRFDVEEVRAAAVARGKVELRVSPDDYPAVLLDETVYSEEGLERKLGYRPEDPLTVVFVRAYRVNPPLELEMDPSYRGCKSWVKLVEDFELDAEPVLPEKEFSRMAGRVRAAL